MNLKNLFNHKTDAPNDISYNQKLIETHQNYISFAKDILNHPYDKKSAYSELMPLNAINKIIRVLALEIQNHNMQYAMQDEHCYFSDSILFNDFPKCPKCGKLETCNFNEHEPSQTLAFNIAQHPTISFPWNKNRLIKAFGTIGTSVNNPFTFHSWNHFGDCLYAPVNLLITTNGFHSITCGIYDTNAIYYPEVIRDFSNFYNEIYFDGLSFRHKKCNTILETPESKSIGTIFEIGRLLNERNLSLLKLLEPIK